MKKNSSIRFQPHSCVVCGKNHSPRILDADKYYAWQNGECIQNVFPELTKDEREILISGTCPKCWEKLFSLAEEDIELENADSCHVITEKEEIEKIDKANAAIEIERLREDFKYEQNELAQREKDYLEMEKLEEKERLENLEAAYYENKYCEYFDNKMP